MLTKNSIISQVQGHKFLIEIKEDLVVNKDNYEEEEKEFIKEFSFVGIENHWFSFGQLEKIEKIWLEHGFKEEV